MPIKSEVKIIPAATAIFFKTVTQDEIAVLLKECDSGEQIISTLIERHYETFRNVSAFIRKKWMLAELHPRGDDDIITVDDACNTACICLLENFAPKLSATRENTTAGQVGYAICMWIAQKIKRMVFSELKHYGVHKDGDGVKFKRYYPKDSQEDAVEVASRQIAASSSAPEKRQHHRHNHNDAHRRVSKVYSQAKKQKRNDIQSLMNLS